MANEKISALSSGNTRAVHGFGAYSTQRSQLLAASFWPFYGNR